MKRENDLGCAGRRLKDSGDSDASMPMEAFMDRSSKEGRLSLYCWWCEVGE